jgi:murein DD-endopeptidase MepM/ murein hydrolase activator NlpD
VAAASGVVRYVGWDPYDSNRDRAWVVIVRHAGGLDSWYAHLLPRRIDGAKAGDRVAGGQLIGLMGATGKATGVHLHFMARLGGSFVNPRRFLPEGERRPPRTRPAPRVPRADAQRPHPI